MVEQANNDAQKLEEYDPTANPVGDLPLFDGIETKLVNKPAKSESKIEKEEPEKEISTTADVNNVETKVVSASSLPHMERPRKTLAQMAAEAQKESTAGKIVCPHCGCQDFRTTNTKVDSDGYRKRLRRCRHCGYPVNTIEFAVRE
jgi:DNA-directed RNA polymerase subunit RPC12/RpoP